MDKHVVHGSLEKFVGALKRFVQADMERAVLSKGSHMPHNVRLIEVKKSWRWQISVRRVTQSGGIKLKAILYSV